MGLFPKGSLKKIQKEINIEEVRALSKLDDLAYEKKYQRDQELEAIIRGEDQRILW